MFIPQLSCLRALLLKTSENGFGARNHGVPLACNNPATAFFLMVSMYALAQEKASDEDAARGRSWAGTSSCSCMSTVFAFPGAVVAPGGPHAIGKAVRADWSSAGDVDNRARLANLDVNCRRGLGWVRLGHFAQARQSHTDLFATNMNTGAGFKSRCTIRLPCRYASACISCA